MRAILMFVAIAGLAISPAIVTAADNVGGVGYSNHVTAGLNNAMDATGSMGVGGGLRPGSVGPSSPVTSSVGGGDSGVAAGKGFKSLVGGTSNPNLIVAGHNARTSMGGVGTTSAVPGGIGK